MGCRIGFAIAPAPLEPATSGPVNPPPVAAPLAPAPSGPSGTYLAPQNPATSGQTDLPIPAAVALPANATTPDASTTRKFYTLTASLREIYDSNVSTSSTGAKASFETDLSPSVLVDFPDTTGDFTARYTLGLTYYSVAPNSGSVGNGGDSGGNDQGQLQITHELVAQYFRTFSERFGLSAAESFRYFTEPSILQSTGTNYQDGPYYTNILNGTLTAQWTPLISSTATFSDTVVKYQDAAIASGQDSIENNGSASVGYAILPKITASLGGIVDNINYQSSERGYTTYTAFGGASWQALPSVSVSGRGGASYVITGQAQGQNQTQSSISPYAALDLSWTLGARSSLTFSYAHEVTPSDQVGTNGQNSDRFNASFSYLITSRLSTHLNGVFTASTYSGGLSGPTVSSSYQEDDYEVDTGLTFQYNSEFNFDTGITVSGVLSNQSNAINNNYNRDEAYVGVRGTY